MLESLVTLFVVTIMIALLASIGSVRDANRKSALRSKAGALADEEVNALRRLDFSLLTNQTNGSFKNVQYNAGTWTIGTDNADLGSSATQHVAPGVLDVAAVSGFGADSVSSRLLLPAGTYGDITLEAKWKVVSPATNWSVGFLIRARDNNNGYRLRVAETDKDLDTGTAGVQNIILEKLVNGTPTKLSPALNATLATGAWFTLKLTATGSSLTITLNGTDLATVTDATYTTGPVALAGWSGVRAEVDDVKTVAVGCSSATCWDLESLTALPAGWIRLGLNDLPDATPTTLDDNGVLTIASYPSVSSTDLKQATITVNWQHQGVTQSYTTTSLIGKSGLGL